jgi:hypothetical protein
MPRDTLRLSWRLAALPALLLVGMACGQPRAAVSGAPRRGEGSGALVRAGDELDQRRPCDPVSSREPAPPPPSTGAVCGNGVLEEIAGTCFEICAGGCAQPVKCRIECSTERERCDGAAHDFTCESQGYAGGPMRCTKACELDLSACVACIPGPGVLCGTAALGGDEVHVVTSALGAAVFARENSTGRLTGAKVHPTLRTQRFASLPSKTLAIGALDGALGFVDEQRRFGLIDADTGRARTLGSIGADSSPIHIARETFQRGGAAVLTGGHSRRTLAIFDAPGKPARAEPRHFHLGNLRIVVVPGAHDLARAVTRGGADLAVLAFGNEIFAYQRDGLELTPLPKVPAGIELSFVYPVYTDTLRWPSGTLSTTRRTDPDTNAPPRGLSRAALSGASMAEAFNGVLMARQVDEGRPHTELYWLAAPDPLAPSRTVAGPSAVTRSP